MDAVAMAMPMLLYGNEFWMLDDDGIERQVCADCTTKIHIGRMDAWAERVRRGDQ